jgi:hypothetical protein
MDQPDDGMKVPRWGSKNWSLHGNFLFSRVNASCTGRFKCMILKDVRLYFYYGTRFAVLFVQMFGLCKKTSKTIYFERLIGYMAKLNIMQKSETRLDLRKAPVSIFESHSRKKIRSNAAKTTLWAGIALGRRSKPQT